MANEINFTEITPKILELTQLCVKNDGIDPTLYNKYEVKRGLRDLNGQGVLAGLTEVSEVRSNARDASGASIPCEGKLFYRGYDVEELVNGAIADNRYGFEEVSYLLMFGQLPSAAELSDFTEMLARY
ncbi:MAG: citrate/2-methylcitrate synthase, partial [Oscillospiraceae bacterium]